MHWRIFLSVTLCTPLFIVLLYVSLCIYVYIYTYIYTYVYIHVYIYIYHCLNKDYFIDVDEFSKLNISGNVLRKKNLRRQDTNINLIAIN